MNYMAGRTILDGYAQNWIAHALERQIGALCSERLLASSGHPAVEIARRAHGKSVKSSRGETDNALASFTMFSRPTFRSPRSTPPM